MVLLMSTAVIAAFITSVLGHFNYDRLVVNDQLTELFEYVRKPDNEDTHNPFWDINSTDFRCNVGASSGVQTLTYTVKAGDSIGFSVNETFGHPGPQQAYMSRAPGLASEYDGSGDWFRVYSAGTVEERVDTPPLTWATHRACSFTFQLSEDIPAGEYLLRAEGIAVHAAHKLDQAQFYISCAQIKVESSGTGTPGPLVKIPGMYTPTTPGVLIPDRYTYILNYTAPGPAMWPEGTTELRAVRQVPGWNPDPPGGK